MSHSLSRGSLASIRNGGGYEDPNCIPEHEQQWLKQVYAASMTFGDSAYMCADSIYMDEDSEIISRLWGIYYNTCPLNSREFNPDYFSPSNR
jgi:hypothetical protein